LTPGQRHEAVVFPRLLAGGGVKRQGRGRPKSRPHRLVGDKADSSRQNRRYGRRHGIRVTLPRKSNEHRTGPFDRTSHRQRNQMDRLINRYKQFRRIATRDEKRAANSQAMWCLATLVLWWGVCKYALLGSGNSSDLRS
jgi:hypothetical protein